MSLSVYCSVVSSSFLYIHTQSTTGEIIMKTEKEIREEIKKISSLQGDYSKKNNNHQAFARRILVEKLLWVLD